jgi:hypothetical protein
MVRGDGQQFRFHALAYLLYLLVFKRALFVKLYSPVVGGAMSLNAKCARVKSSLPSGVPRNAIILAHLLLLGLLVIPRGLHAQREHIDGERQDWSAKEAI